MQNVPVDFSKTRIIVFELSQYPMSNAFIKKVSQLSDTEKYRQIFKANLVVFDATSVLTRGDYYLLDGHIRDESVEKFATAILKHTGLQ